MSDDTHLRRTERDLYTAAEEIREGDIPKAREEKERVEEEAREYGDIQHVPQELHERHERLKQRIRELVGTADTYEEYADRWTDDGASECLFVLEEHNGDEYAATIDAVTGEAESQGRRESIPEGYGRVKALEYGVKEKPTGAPADPGQWPAPIVNELFEELQAITAPSGVDLGNESLEQAMQQRKTNPDTPDAR